MAQKVSFATLLDWLEDRLPPEEAQQVAAAVATDNALRATVAWIQEFGCLTDGLVLANPPPSLRRRLEALFAEHSADEGGTGRWRCFNAEPAGQQIEKGERRLAYTTPVAEITLALQQRSREARYDLHGAILFPGDEQPLLTVELLRDDCPVEWRATDPWGEFGFARLPAGEYRLVFTGEDVELTIPELKLGAI